MNHIISRLVHPPLTRLSFILRVCLPDQSGYFGRYLVSRKVLGIAVSERTKKAEQRSACARGNGGWADEVMIQVVCDE